MGILEGEPRRLEHPALLYGDIDAFLAVMVPFVTGGLDAGEPVVVAVASTSLRPCVSGSGSRTAGARWLDTREWLPHPASRLRAFHHLVKR